MDTAMPANPSRSSCASVVGAVALTLIVLTLLAFGAVVFGSSGKTCIVVHNVSGETIEALTVEGAGFSATLHQLAPDATFDFRPPITGESSLRVRPAGAAEPIELEAYFEGHSYLVRLDVLPDGEFRVEVDLALLLVLP